MKTSLTITISAALLLIAVLISGCKTTEANYRAAYEKAIAAREDDERETIYGGVSRQLGTRKMVENGDTAQVMIKNVSPVTIAGVKQPEVKKYMLVVGEFKQLFNAESMCKRFVNGGYSSAVVVQTAEPYYYIVADSFDSIKDAKKAIAALQEKSPIALKSPAPFILRDPRK